MVLAQQAKFGAGHCAAVCFLGLQTVQYAFVLCDSAFALMQFKTSSM
jgi:hypothetical protein